VYITNIHCTYSGLYIVLDDSLHELISIVILAYMIATPLIARTIACQIGQGIVCFNIHRRSQKQSLFRQRNHGKMLHFKWTPVTLHINFMIWEEKWLLLWFNTVLTKNYIDDYNVYTIWYVYVLKSIKSLTIIVAVLQQLYFTFFNALFYRPNGIIFIWSTSIKGDYITSWCVRNNSAIVPFRGLLIIWAIILHSYLQTYSRNTQCSSTFWGFWRSTISFSLFCLVRNSNSSF